MAIEVSIGGNEIEREDIVDAGGMSLAWKNPGVDFCVDSVSGDDAGSGAYPDEPRKSLASIPWADNLTVGFKYGSVWYEECDLSAYSGIVLFAYGEDIDDGMPTIDGTDVITGWVASGTTNVWQATVAHNATGTNRGTVYEDDALLTRVANSAACSAAAGSFVDIKGSDGSPWTVKIHTGDSGNPNTNGKVYRVPKRASGLVTGADVDIDGIRTQQVISNNGSLSVGANANVKRALMVYGTKHNALFDSGQAADVIACRVDPPTSYEVSNAMFVVFAPDSAGKSMAVERMFCLADGYGAGLTSPLICHDSSNHHYVEFAATQLASTMPFAFNPTALAVSLRGLFANGCIQPFAATTDAGTFQYIQARGGAAGTGISLNKIAGSSVWNILDSVFYDGGSNDGLLRLGSGLNGCSLLVSRSVLYHSAGRPTVRAEGMSSGLVGINQSLITYPHASIFAQIEIPNGVTYSGDYNAFLGPVAALNLRYHGTTYNSLADWQAATGQDAHSIALDPTDLGALFSGNVANGDFRLGVSGAGALARGLECGPSARWGWDARAPVSGPPSQWPRMPITMIGAENYIRDPMAWRFFQ